MRLDQSSVDLSTLADKIERHEIDLQPDFQRGQVWSEAKKKRLIDTILREWYVPAIHIVVNDELDREEVLDGQQRIRSILEFMHDQFEVDGRVEPEDSRITSLHGLKYSQLPDATRSRFRRFPITTVRLRDYRPEEPGELFFRLNQLTALTAAEQRNALFGEPRNQIRDLARSLEEVVGHNRLGFSNARMNYDDVLSRLAVSLELGLGEKITAAKLEKRYRHGTGFSATVTRRVEHSIEQLSDIIADQQSPTRFNKATLFSWMFFIADYESDAANYDLPKLFQTFESIRSTFEVNLVGEDLDIYVKAPAGQKLLAECATIFNDRSSSRVNDVSSVILRDLALSVAATVLAPKLSQSRLFRMRQSFLTTAAARISRLPKDVGPRAFEEAELAKLWEQRREAHQA